MKNEFNQFLELQVKLRFIFSMDTYSLQRILDFLKNDVFTLKPPLMKNKADLYKVTRKGVHNYFDFVTLPIMKYKTIYSLL